MNKENTLPMNADTLNAIVDAMGALTMCLAKQLTPTQKSGLAQDLARLSAQMHATGKEATALLLSDISRAAHL